MTLRNVFCLAAIMVLFAGASVTQAAPDFADPEEQPKEFDWIKLNSDEWLKGELHVLYNHELEFDSDKLDLQIFDWEDVIEIRTARVLAIRFTDQTDGIGKVIIRGQEVYFNGHKDSHTRADIISMASGAPKGLDLWSLKMRIGGDFKRGNTVENSTDFEVDLKRRSNTNRFVAQYLASTQEDDGVESEDSHRFYTYDDRFLTNQLYWRIIALEYFKDEFQNIANRTTIGSGIGYTIIENDRTSWDVTLSPAYQRTEYVTVENNENRIEESPALVFETMLEYDITSDIDLNAVYNAQFTEKESGRYKHHAELGVDIDLTDKLDLDVTAYWDRTENPQPDENGLIPKKDDTRLSIGLSYEF